jgi:predicted RNA-binding Zn-ribbon protein involved in translation (DUF1610 family)
MMIGMEPGRAKMDTDLLKAVPLLESIAPGIVFGMVDVVCRACGESSVHRCDTDGRNTYECPVCGMMTEL